MAGRDYCMGVLGRGELEAVEAAACSGTVERRRLAAGAGRACAAEQGQELEPGALLAARAGCEARGAARPPLEGRRCLGREMSRGLGCAQQRTEHAAECSRELGDVRRRQPCSRLLLFP